MYTSTDHHIHFTYHITLHSNITVLPSSNDSSEREMVARKTSKPPTMLPYLTSKGETLLNVIDFVIPGDPNAPPPLIASETQYSRRSHTTTKYILLCRLHRVTFAVSLSAIQTGRSNAKTLPQTCDSSATRSSPHPQFPFVRSRLITWKHWRNRQGVVYACGCRTRGVQTDVRSMVLGLWRARVEGPIVRCLYYV